MNHNPFLFCDIRTLSLAAYILFLYDFLFFLGFIYTDRIHFETEHAKRWKIACNWTLHGRHLAVFNAVTVW